MKSLRMGGLHPPCLLPFRSPDCGMVLPMYPAMHTLPWSSLETLRGVLYNLLGISQWSCFRSNSLLQRPG